MVRCPFLGCTNYQDGAGCRLGVTPLRALPAARACRWDVALAAALILVILIVSQWALELWSRAVPWR